MAVSPEAARVLNPRSHVNVIELTHSPESRPTCERTGTAVSQMPPDAPGGDYVFNPMRSVLRALLAILAVGIVWLAVAAWWRVTRVNTASAAIPVHPGARESGGDVRYFPRVLSWDDRSSARVRRVFALPETLALNTIARHAQATLGGQGWYLVTPDDLDRIRNPQVIIWQRDPDERLDLTMLWPLTGMTRDQRLYGGIFPPEFLDAPLVIEWSWALGGPRSARPEPPHLEVLVPFAPRGPASQ